VYQAHSSGESSAVSASPVVGGKRGSKGKGVEEKPAKRMRTDSGRATYAQPTPAKSKGKVQVWCQPDEFMYYTSLIFLLSLLHRSIHSTDDHLQITFRWCVNF